MKAKVEGYGNLTKNINTGVIDLTDSTERFRYRIARDQAQTNINNQYQIEKLGNELAEIKSLLKQIVTNNGT